MWPVFINKQVFLISPLYIGEVGITKIEWEDFEIGLSVSCTGVYVLAQGNLSVLRVADLLLVHCHSLSEAIACLPYIVVSTSGTCYHVDQVF